MSPPSASGGPNPPPLTTAASLVAVEGLVLVALGVVEVLNVAGERLSLGVATAVFFAVYGAVLVLAGLALTQRRTWARGPALLTQLIMLGLAWNLRDYVLPAVVLAVAALVTVAGIVHPASTEALEGSRED